MQAFLSALRSAVKDVRSGRSGGVKLQFSPTKIKELRNTLGLTQEAFSEKVGVSVATVRSWEQDQRKPGAIAKVMMAALVDEMKSKQRV
jgi:DNA-binding transcriptional regulator YiaG